MELRNVFVNGSLTTNLPENHQKGAYAFLVESKGNSAEYHYVCGPLENNEFAEFEISSAKRLLQWLTEKNINHSNCIFNLQNNQAIAWLNSLGLITRHVDMQDSIHKLVHNYASLSRQTGKFVEAVGTLSELLEYNKGLKYCHYTVYDQYFTYMKIENDMYLLETEALKEAVKFLYVNERTGKPRKLFYTPAGYTYCNNRVLLTGSLIETLKKLREECLGIGYDDVISLREFKHYVKPRYFEEYRL